MIKRFCYFCKNEFMIWPYRKKEARFCSRQCQFRNGISKEAKEKMSIAKKGKHLSPKTEFKKGQNVGEKHPNWRGGIMHMTQGYICQYFPDHPNANKAGYVYQHRLIMEKKLGRYLAKQEIVHHLNGVKNDNRPENLICIPNNSIHMKHEWSTNTSMENAKKNWYKNSYKKI
jgi:flagellar basal body rod protein FlgC